MSNNNLFDKIKQSFSNWLISLPIKTLSGQIQYAFSQLREVDTILTDIRRLDATLSEADLADIGKKAYAVADKYGQNVTDYLSTVRSLTQAGYKNATELADLTLSLQNAGDLTADLAQTYITAADHAYDLNGNIQQLRTTLDGANSISNLNAVNLSDLAVGMTTVGTQAADAGVQISEVTAAIGTMATATNVTGADAGNAFLNILNNLSFSDNSLQTPMEQLAAIADTYQNLDADSSERSNILSLLGTENDQAAIDALLSNWNLYQTMLSEYATGSGSISEEAALTADSWESSTNRLQNSWVNFIDTLVDQDAIVGTTNALSDLLNGIASITDTVGALPPLIAGVTAILGQDKLFCPIWQ
ncbi:MAG: phage tail tape measure protein [Clostridium sp.]|nr:phage tail tape measure protein [Clostridium sp.]